MIILDTFCKAGGAGSGYALAGFDVVGVDIEPQPNYPFEFHQADAIEFIRDNGREFDAIHASPPCQAYSVTRNVTKADHHPELIEPTRDALRGTGRPYIIENVVGAPLHSPVLLCGSMFRLRVRRHRLFEVNWHCWQLKCLHGWQNADKPFHSIKSAARGGSRPTGVVSVFGTGTKVRDTHGTPEVELWREAMGIDWMTKAELAQAIPPRYTEYIGANLVENAGTMT